MNASARPSENSRPAPPARVFTRPRLERLWSYVRPDAWKLGLVLALVLLTSALQLAPPVLMEQFVDRAAAGRLDRRFLLIIVLATAVLSIGGAALAAIRDLTSARASMRVSFRMRLDFFEHLHRLPLRFFVKTRLGDILMRLTRDLGEVHGIATGAALSFLSSIATAAGTAVLLFHYNRTMFAWTLAAALPAILLARYFRGLVQRRARAVRDANDDLSSFLVESLGAMKTVRAFGRERRAARRFSRYQSIVVRRAIRAVIGGAAASGIPNLVVGACTLGIFYYGGMAVVRGEEEVGDLIAYAALQARVIGPLRGLVGLYLEVQRAGVGLERVFEFLETPPERSNGTARLPPGPGAMRLEGVSFAHEPSRPALVDVSLALPAGRLTIVLGPNGAGKTTLLDVMLGLAKPSAGRVLIDDVDIATLARSELLGAFGLVPQEATLFHASLRENILFGDPRAGAATLDRAVRLAGLEPLLARLPEGLATVVGERGVGLSGGERQRVALARTLVREPRILVLDESAAHLDPAADRAWLETLRKALEGTTRIAITHGESQAAFADYVVRLDGGRVVRSGTPEDLGFERRAVEARADGETRS